jgi:hypothetical protein
MTIDWQSLLRRYMTINYVPMTGSEDAKLFSGEELAALEDIEAEVAEREFFECLDLDTANPERTRVEELAAFVALDEVVAELQGEGLDIKWGREAPSRCASMGANKVGGEPPGRLLVRGRPWTRR